MPSDNPPHTLQAVFIVGTTCTGKSEAGKYLSTRGFRWIEPSRFLAEHVPLAMPLLERLNAIDEFFRDHGPDYIAKRLLAEALAGPSGSLVITGCRQPIERDILMERFTTRVVALHTSSRTRYERTRLRTRQD